MMLQKKKLFIPKQILASKNILLTKHNDGFAQEIFAKYSVLRNDFAAWFELFFKVDSTYEDYNRTDIGQLLINVRMQLQLQEESSKSSLSILGQQELFNFKKQLENTVKTLYSSAGHQSLKYINEKLLKSDITNSILFEKAYNREIYINRPLISYIYGNYTKTQKAINAYNYNNSKPYNAAWGTLKNALSLSFNNITGRPNLESILSHLTQFYINGNRKTKNSLHFKSVNPYYDVSSALLNALTLNFNTIPGRLDLENTLSLLNKVYINGYRNHKNSFNFKSINPYYTVNSALLNALPLNFNTFTGRPDIDNVLSLLNKFYINGDTKAKSSLNFKSIRPYYAVNRDLLNALTLNFNTIPGRLDLENTLSILNQLYVNGDTKVKNSLNFKNIRPYYAVNKVLLKALSLNFDAITGSPDSEKALSLLNKFYIDGDKPDLESVFRIPVFEINSFRKGNNSFYLKYKRDNIGTIYTRVNMNRFNRLYSNMGKYEKNYENIIHMNPYNFKNYYRLYFPGLSSYVGAGFKMAYIQGESIKEFSSIIHNKIVDGLRNNLPEVLRSGYRLDLLGVNRARRKQKKEMDSETKEFWHNMTYNIIQGFRKELESKTSYFFTNQIDKRAYGLSPFLEDEGEDEENANGNWKSQENLIHKKHAYITNFSEQERGRITPHSINNLRKTYPDIYNMLTFAGLLPTLYVQKHSRETAMGLLSKSIHQYYIGNRNLTVRAYDLLRNKLETEEKGFIWPEAMNNYATMEFRSVRKAQRGSSQMAEIQALRTQVVNIEKQTLQSVQYSNVNINGLVERVYREIEQKIKVDRVRRGY